MVCTQIHIENIFVVYPVVLLAKEIIENRHRIFYARSDKLPEGSFSLSLAYIL